MTDSIPSQKELNLMYNNSKLRIQLSNTQWLIKKLVALLAVFGGALFFLILQTIINWF
jgi:hypothetical protein